MDDMQMEMVNLQERQMTREERKQQIHERLSNLQNWDLGENQTLAERRAEHNEMLIGKELKENKQMRKRWMQIKQSIHAKKTAEGTPAQIQKPAKKTFKQKREDERLDEVARQRAPLADHVSIHMVESLRSYQDLRDNSFDLITADQLAQAKNQNLDLRPLHVFLYGYKRNAAGEPLDADERFYRDLDQRFINDYLSLDAQRRKPHLDRMVDQVLRVNISDDMLTEEYMETHAGEMQQQINRMVTFQNIMNDPVNAGYFQALPETTKQLLNHRVLDRYPSCGVMLARICSLKAVNPDMGRILPEIGGVEDEDALRQALDMERQASRETLARSRMQEREMIETEYARLCNEEKQRLIPGDRERMRAIEEEHLTTAQGADMSGLGLTSLGAGYSVEMLANYRKMIEDHPEEYSLHGQRIEALYQELYRSLDSYGDLKQRAMIAQGVIDELNITIPYNGEAKDAFVRRASLDADEVAASTNVVQMQINAITDALTSLLEDVPMSDPGARMLHRLGY